MICNLDIYKQGYTCTKYIYVRLVTLWNSIMSIYTSCTSVLHVNILTHGYTEHAQLQKL